jgi:Arc/MetJ-type ribon-helix-helix transcriptional regulator
MNRPVDQSQVTVRISAEDAADLQARVDRGEFASLDEGLAAELAELNYRRAADIVGGSEKLEALLDELEQTDDPSTDVDADDFFKALRVGLKERLAPSRG